MKWDVVHVLGLAGALRLAFDLRDALVEGPLVLNSSCRLLVPFGWLENVDTELGI